MDTPPYMVHPKLRSPAYNREKSVDTVDTSAKVSFKAQYRVYTKT